MFDRGIAKWLSDLSISIPSAGITSYVSKTSRNIVHMEMI